MIFEELYRFIDNESDLKIGEHKDINDQGQTVTVKTPTITGSTAVSLSESKTVGVGIVDINDAVFITGLVHDETYDIVTQVRDESGRTIKEQVLDDFSASGPSGDESTIHIEIKDLDTRDHTGETLTVYNRLYNSDRTVEYGGWHPADNDEAAKQAESIEVANAAITTSVAYGKCVAKSGITLDGIDSCSNSNQEVSISKNAAVHDRVVYDGLINGDSYYLFSKIVDNNGTEVGKKEEVVIANCATATTDCPQSSDSITGFWTVDFVIDTTNYIGQTLTVYEYLYKDENSYKNGGNAIAEHASEMTEEERILQSVTVPAVSIGTEAWVGSQGTKTAGVGTVDITDRVSYVGLTGGEWYKIKGKLVRINDAGEIVEEVTNTNIRFQASVDADNSGFLDIVFENINTSKFIGEKLVVLEYLYPDIDLDSASEDDILAYHTELNDNNQTIIVSTPSIQTKSTTDKNNNKSVLVSENAVIYDRINMTGLVNGETYYFVNRILNKTDGDNVVTKYIRKDGTNDDANSFVSNQDGSLDETIVFGLDTRNLAGKELTIQEEVYYGEGNDRVKIAEHTETTPEQTVTVAAPTISTSAKNADDESTQNVGVGKVNIIDYVSLNSLTNGETYWLKAELKNSDDGAVLSSTKVNFTVGENGVSNQVPVRFINFDTTELSGKTVYITETLYAGEIDDTTYKIAEHVDNIAEQQIHIDTPRIGTTASDNLDNDKAVGVGKIEIKDEITYEGLVPGQTYTLETKLVDNEEHDLKDAYSGIDYNMDKNSFVASQTGNGTETVIITLDNTAKLQSEEVNSITVFEYLKFENKIISKHEELNSSQTVTVDTPTLQTIARDGSGNDDNDKTVGVGEVIIKDKVSYTNLIAGQKYKLAATIVDKTTSEAIGCSAEKEFTATTGSSSTEEIEIECNTKNVAGKRLVVFEKLYYIDEEQVEIAEHEDINDQDQYIDVETPEIGTIATAITKAYDDEKIVDITEEAIIKDRIRYSGLVIGNRYKVEGVLYDKGTSELILVDGREVKASYSWVADKEQDDNGVEVTFEMDTTNFPGKTLVAFEKLYLITEDGEEEIAKHEDITDGDQSIEVKPRVGTKVIDKQDNDQAIGVGKVEVVDSVIYEGLKTGKTYLAKGELIDRSTKSPIKQTLQESACESNEVKIALNDMDVYKCGDRIYSKSGNVEGYTLFTIGEAGYMGIVGTVGVEFTFETDQLQGKELVVFEKLYEIEINPSDGQSDQGDKYSGLLRSEHEDLNDTDQLIAVKNMSIGTIATDESDGDKELDVNDSVKVNDEIEYRGLVKGMKYKVVGNLVDKENPTLSVGYAEAEFTAEGENGKYIVTFTTNTKELSGKELVAFERLFYINEENKEVEIAKHEDLSDQKQTVWVKVQTPNTGVFGAINEGGTIQRISIVAIAIGSLGAIYIVFVRKAKIRFK